MPQLLESMQSNDYLAIATEVFQELAATAYERDMRGGIPEQEVELLRKSGLLRLSIPKEYGGMGANWLECYRVIQRLSNADGSTGQIFANHVTLVTALENLGRPGQAEAYYRMTAQYNLCWGNALNARDARLKIEPEGDHFRVNGVKSFGTGLITGDLRVVGAVQDGVPFPIAFIIPRDRGGITYNNDWNNMGQRCTASGSYTFNNVWVNADELVGPPPDPTSAFATLVFVVVQLSKTFLYLGVAEGALNAAQDYTLHAARPWMTSGVEKAAQDPYILHHYGELWTELQAAIALSERAAQIVQAAWDKGTDLTQDERAEAAIAVYAAKAMAIKAGLAVTNGIFDGMGARATASKYGFDRYWRDLRTFSLHDPIAYKYQAIGDWLLNQTHPTPSQYS